MLAKLKQLDRWLDSHLILILLLGLLLILRIPNFSEPYWYGDEGIYLTIGNGLRQGKVLYHDIVDHKTPLIYYFAMVPNQLYFRLLNLFWMSIATLAFFHLSKELLNKTWTIILSSVVFIFLTSLPWLEGNIPNGELFVLGFTLMGFYFLSGTKVLNDIFVAENKLFKMIGVGNKEETLSAIFPKIFANNNLLIFISGIFFGLGILTKVPAVFDLFAGMSIFWLAFINNLFEKKITLISLRKNLIILAKRVGIILAGAFLPILLSIFYFALRGALSDYLQFGLLYNFHYVQNWQLPFDNLILNFLFTAPGKILFVGVILVIISFAIKKLSNAVRFALFWFFLSLFAALLSNRPYPHYFIQVIPSLALLLGLLFDAWTNVYLKNKKLEIELGLKAHSLINTLAITSALLLMILVMLLLKFRPYPATSYYYNFTKHALGLQNSNDYYGKFNYLMTDNYEAAQIIRNSGEKEIFIWGTNPMLYALSKTSPVGKFTVAFHIKDLGLDNETFKAIKAQKPAFIVTMNNEEQLPGLNSLLKLEYYPNTSFKHFTLWKLL